MIPCLNLEEAIIQLKNDDERQEIDYLFRCYKEDVQDRINCLESEAEKVDDYYESWQEAEGECDNLQEQIDELEDEADKMKMVRNVLNKVSGQITPDEALNILNSLMVIVGKPGLVIGEEESLCNELPF